MSKVKRILLTRGPKWLLEKKLLLNILPFESTFERCEDWFVNGRLEEELKLLYLIIA
jgi:hypothetical protein